jgi:hypothetical protein
VLNTAAEQRSEPRLAPPSNSIATLFVLQGSLKSAPLPVKVVNFSGRGLKLNANQTLAPGTLVRVDLNRTMILGEVCYAEPAEGGFAIGLRLEHSLTITDSLERLRQRFAEDEATATVSR